MNVSLAGEASGTGHTLKNLFSGFPQGTLMQLSLQMRPDEFCTTIGNTVFIDEHCIPVYFRVRRLADALSRIAKPERRSSRAARPSTSIRQVSAAGKMRGTVSSYLDLLRCRLTREVYGEIVRFSPTVIYTAGSSIRVHSVANNLSEALGIPIVLHLMDDWPQTIYTSTVLSRLPRRILLAELARTNARSYSNFAISEPLCRKYSSRYGRQYQPLMNPALHIRPSTVVHEHRVMDMVYAGSLGLGRRDGLLRVARAIAEVNSPTVRARMSLFIPDAEVTVGVRTAFEDLGCSISGYISSVELQRRYDEADVLVHVESFSPEYRDFTRLSLSTKIPECMGAGKPILAFLPDDLYGSTYIRSRGCGVVVTAPELLKAEIIKLMEDGGLRERLGSRGLEAARAEHSVEAVQARLMRALSTASRSAMRG